MGKFGVHVHKNKLNSSQHHNKSELEGPLKGREEAHGDVAYVWE